MEPGIPKGSDSFVLTNRLGPKYAVEQLLVMGKLQFSN
jgi:hypothetical protein